MRTKYTALGAAVAAIAAATVAVMPATAGVFSSSDRSGDRIMLDPSADNTDVYASSGAVLTVKAIPLVD